MTAIADLVSEKELIAEPGTWSRNLHYQWVCFALTEMEPYVHSTEINSIDFVLPERQHVRGIIEQNSMCISGPPRCWRLRWERLTIWWRIGFRPRHYRSITISWGQEQGLLNEFQNLRAYLERLLGREHCTLKRH